jgi:hypothetical protein
MDIEIGAVAYAAIKEPLLAIGIYEAFGYWTRSARRLR